MRPMGNYVFTAAARFSLIAGQLAYVKLVTHYLDLPQVGMYYLLVTASYFANALVFVPFDYFQQSTITSVFTKTRSLIYYIRPNLLISSVFLGLLLGTVLVAAFISQEAAYAIAIAGLFSIGSYVPIALRGALNILGHSNKVNATQLLEGVLRPVVGIFFLTLTSRPSAVILMASGCLTSFIISAILIRELLKAKVFTVPLADSPIWSWRDVLAVTSPISASAITNWIQLQGYRIVLVPLGYADAVGIYSVMSNLGHAGMGAISGIYSQVNLPKIYRNSGSDIGRYLIGIGSLTLAGAVGVLIFGSFLVPLVTNNSYKAYFHIATFGVLIEGGAGIIGCLTVYFAIKSRTKIVATSGILAACLSCLGIAFLYLTGSISPLSVGSVLLISQCISVIALYFSYLKSRKVFFGR